MRKPFKDWTLENFVGLAMLATVILLVVSGLTADPLRLLGWHADTRPAGADHRAKN